MTTTDLPAGFVRPKLNRKKPIYMTNDTCLPPHLKLPTQLPTQLPNCVKSKSDVVTDVETTDNLDDVDIRAGFSVFDPYYNPITPKIVKKAETPKRVSTPKDAMKSKNVVEPKLASCARSPKVVDRVRTPSVSIQTEAVSEAPGMIRPLCARTPKFVDRTPKNSEVYPGMSPGMKLPRCATTPPVRTSVDDDYNPWIPETTEGARYVKILARTPIGTIARVPTSNHQPVYIPKPIEVADNKSILNASIYLDLSDRDYNYVSSKMRSLNENTKNLQKQYANVLQPYPKIKNPLSPLNPDKFEQLLLVYENNQVYYQDLLDAPNPEIPEISIKLQELEQWFVSFSEPRPHDKLDLDAWRDREKFRKTHNISQYCDPILYKYLVPPGDPLLSIKDD
jgi:hypothetical protein